LSEVCGGEWTVGAGTGGEAVAASRDDLAQGVADRGEVAQFLLDLDEFDLGALAKVVGGMPVAAGVEKFGDFVKGEAEALRALDDPEQGHGVDGVGAVAAGVRWGSVIRPRRS
jgi:hypothetical protein